LALSEAARKYKRRLFHGGRENDRMDRGLSFLSANLGCSSSWMAGASISTGYWPPTVLVGAIPAMLFLGIVMMPFITFPKTHSVPGI